MAVEPHFDTHTLVVVGGGVRRQSYVVPQLCARVGHSLCQARVGGGGIILETLVQLGLGVGQAG